MQKVELEILNLSHSISQTNSFAVVLSEVNGNRRLPIVIGAFEAQAIAVAFEKIPSSRPLTHDLIKNILTEFNIHLHEVLIKDLQEGVFFSTLLCTFDGKTYEIDSRTSDAIALAIRFGAPIFIDEKILDSAAITLEGEAKAKPKKPGAKIETKKSEIKNLEECTTDELQQMLKSVLDNEDYNAAIAIRDEMKRRNEKS